MLIEKDTIKAESHFSEDRQHKFLTKRTWNKDKPALAVIMLQSGFSDNLVNDTTTGLVVNSVARLETYGSVHILNLYSKITNHLNFRYNSDEDLSPKENDEYILKSAAECEKIVLAWGRTEDTNMRVAERVLRVIKLLTPYKDKLCCISDGKENFYHPLFPGVRQGWQLEPVDVKKWNTNDKNHNIDNNENVPT